MTPPNTSQPLRRASSLPTELSDIRAYIDAANYHITKLSAAAEVSAHDSLADIKHRLKDAHAELEKLEGQFAFIGEIKRQVWQTYRRLRDFEERMKMGGGAAGDVGMGVGGIEIASGIPETEEEDVDVPMRDYGAGRRPRQRVIRAVPAVQMASVMGRAERDTDRVASGVGEEAWSPGGERLSGATEVSQGQQFLAVPDAAGRARSKTATSKLAEAMGMNMVPKVVPVAKPSVRGRGYEDSPQPRAVTFPEELPKSRREVLESIAREERHKEAQLYRPLRQRQGSAEGWLVTQAVMTANSDPRVCLPHFAYIKIHEVRDLKLWLSKHRYLRKSRGISKTEKLLYLLTLLQVGCRFESVAVLFSRTPREVLASCKEAFEGLLELHSETMLPHRNILKKYFYPDLWHIVYNYGIEWEDGGDRGHCAWGREDICKVLLTLNIYIGRYRRQGCFALQGDIMDWGRYIHVDHDESTFDVPLWIQRLQAAPPDASMRQDAPG